MTETEPPTPDRILPGAAPPKGSGLSPAPRRHRRARLALAAGGLAVVAVIVLVATRGGSDGPDHAVEDYARAIRDGDCDALVATVSATKWEHDDERFTADFTLVDEDGWKVLFCPAFPSLPCA